MASNTQIFLSYVRADRELVKAVYQELSSKGFRPWMDIEDLFPGEVWRQKIERAIAASDFFLACLSRRSVNKRGFLQREIRNALDLFQEKLPDDIYLIPVRLEDCKVPETLTHLQWVDLSSQDGWERLLRAINVGLHRRENGGPNGDQPAADDRPTLPPVYVTNISGPALPINGSDQPDLLSSVAYPQAEAEKEPKGLSHGPTPALPVATFPEEMALLLERLAPDALRCMDVDSKRLLLTLGTKLEPIIQVIPPTPVPLVIGFESLALGSLGENFTQICTRLKSLDQGTLRLLLALVAVKTASMLRTNAARNGNRGARHLIFTLNLGPEMLDCPQLDDFLVDYQCDLDSKLVFEINERTTLRYLRRLKELKADCGLRYCADDFNDWAPELKEALRDGVEMTKVDQKTFQSAMNVRGDNPRRAIETISSHKIRGKPIIVEGVEDPNHIRFLTRHWEEDKFGALFGQGYVVEPGSPWDNWTSDLRTFGLPGGHFLDQRADRHRKSMP
ncbi:MAG TPA: TIR domain-containing protein [Blastocatellia bacterium]